MAYHNFSNWEDEDNVRVGSPAKKINDLRSQEIDIFQTFFKLKSQVRNSKLNYSQIEDIMLVFDHLEEDIKDRFNHKVNSFKARKDNVGNV